MIFACGELDPNFWFQLAAQRFQLATPAEAFPELIASLHN